MSVTPSNMLPLGTIAPNFSLPDTVTGKTLSLNDLKSDQATVIMFICNHCPFVKHILKKLVEVAKIYQEKGMSFIAISSNDVENFPNDSPEKMRDLAIAQNFSFPYLFDESQDIAKAYHAACTPDFFVFDNNLACVYRGRFDAATPANQVAVTGSELTTALDQILGHQTISSDQKPSIGCNIKWKIHNSSVD